MDDENLIDAAPEGQTADEAVAEAPASEPAETETPEASHAEQTTAARLYAGKFKADTELEQGYLHLEREASRMAGELASYRKAQPTTQPANEPEWKKVEAERQKYANYLMQPGLTEEQRAYAWNQISLHDRDIAVMKAFERFQKHSTRESASRGLDADTQAVFETYKQDLSPGSDLYRAAEARYFQMVNAGYPETDSVKADAVLWAAHKTGVVKAKAVSQDRKDFLGNLNRQARAAQKAGAGTATTVKAGGVTAKQIEAMDDAAFAKLERELSLGV